MSTKLLDALVVVAEKAANVARVCRQNQHLFGLLVEEKSENEANPRFLQDFKTLADVLIQEMVKYDLGKQFPALKANIRGEESNKFCNKLGDSICVELLDSKEATAERLALVLDGDKEAADVLAEEVHRTLTLNDCHVEGLNDCHGQDFNELDEAECGIWIDPIDSTAEYINGGDDTDEKGISHSGLKCVTVLIGLFDLTSGKPILGVINQPFYEFKDNKWSGRLYSNTYKCETAQNTNVVCVSSSESPSIKEKLTANGFVVVEAAGAGYKILATIVGLADAYLLTKDSTFKWDTCGPQAILQCGGGGDIVVYERLRVDGEAVALNYVVDDDYEGNKIEACCNRGGILAFRRREVMWRILNAIRE